MNVKVISISSQLEPILSFLFPTYSITDSPSVVNKFIIHRDIKSKSEREALDIRYDDCIFISSQIFDEVWDEAKVKEEVITFSRKNFKNRKTKFDTTSETFVQDCVNFMFGISVEDTDSNIFELFDSFGSVLFIKTFLLKSLTIPIPVLCSAMNTFLIKISSNDGSVYYKKKQMIFQSKIKNNLLGAVDNFNLRSHDGFGLSNVKFYSDLVKES